jgi:hypothetical protein
MPILAESTKTELPEKARLAIKMDMVNPTPARIATPRIWAVVPQDGG